MPLKAIREALTNAIVHADYSQRGAPIRVAIYDDRIEIENPGLLTGGLTLENLRSGVSKLRNRVIGRVFKELNLIEQWGSGFQRMDDNCRQDGFPAPEFEEVGYHFRVTISLQQVREATESVIDQQILACIMQYENKGGASIKDLVTATGLVARSVRRHLAHFVEAGRIVAIGKSAYDPQKRYLPAKESQS